MRLPRWMWEAMVRHAKEWAPLEACGLVGGRTGPGGGEALVFQPTPNEAASPVFYTVPPREILRFQRRLDEEGLELVAVFHSHPATPAYPSPTDVRLAFYPDAVYLILSLAAEPPVLRGFHIQDGAVREVPVEIEPS